jgi:hypothetical protein
MIGIPDAEHVRIDESRDEKVHLPLDQFEKSFVGVEPPALSAGQPARRAQPASLQDHGVDGPARRGRGEFATFR